MADPTFWRFIRVVASYALLGVCMGVIGKAGYGVEAIGIIIAIYGVEGASKKKEADNV